MLEKKFTATKSACKVVFTLPVDDVKNASQVRILGDFNQWNRDQGLIMTPSKKAFKAEIELETGKSYQFRYLVDNSRWLNDQAADEYVTTSFGIQNSVVNLEV